MNKRILFPVDASKVMPDKMMDLMEPYKYGELGDFDAKYLSGFQAEVYDEDKNTLLPRAKKKADKYSQKYLSSYNVEYDAVRPTVNDKKSTEKECRNRKLGHISRKVLSSRKMSEGGKKL